MQDPYRYFRVEARELLDQLGKGTLDLERGPGSGLVARLLRLAHTLKGAARVVKQPEIADRTHAIEDILVPFRDSAATVPRERIEAVLRLLDEIEARMRALDAPVEAAIPGRPEEPTAAVHAESAATDEVLDGLAEAHVQLGGLRQTLVAVGRARHLAELIAAQAVAPAPVRPAPTAGSSLAEELHGVLGGIERGLASGVEQLDRELRQVVEAAERLRLVPARTIFTALERTVRDAARALGRRVTFIGSGGDVRLDPQVLGILQGALLQVVRNAVAHGIEPAEERVAAGKPAEGRVEIAVERRGRQIVFIGSDDGRGVDIEAVRRAAQRQGHAATGIQRPGSEELLRLLLKGGISTSGVVTEVSGRGVGLDVVREAVDRLGGEVEVRSEPGRGTHVELAVPLSLSALAVLIVEVAGAAVAIPREAVRRTLRVPISEITSTADGASIVHDGRAIPFAPLSRLVSSREAAARGDRPWSVVVVEAGGRLGAVGVDRLVGSAEVVVRRLPALAPASALVVGASLDVAGSPRLVLDPGVLVAELGRLAASAPPQAAPRPLILVVDDSLTTRMLEQSILLAAGYAVDVATSGEEALEMVRRQRYALALVDVEMPGIDGFTCIERMRADPALRDLPAMLVTSRASPEDRRRGEQVGACAYIVKSEFDQNDLLERIRRLVG